MPAKSASSKKLGARGGQGLWLVENSRLSDADSGTSAMTAARSLDFQEQLDIF